MGVFYGRAKLCEKIGDTGGLKVSLWAGYLCALFLHGFYDACAMTGTVGASVIFLIFVVLMYRWVIRLMRRESAVDHPV